MYQHRGQCHRTKQHISEGNTINHRMERVSLEVAKRVLQFGNPRIMGGEMFAGLTAIQSHLCWFAIQLSELQWCTEGAAVYQVLKNIWHDGKWRRDGVMEEGWWDGGWDEGDGGNGGVSGGGGDGGDIQKEMKTRGMGSQT